MAQEESHKIQRPLPGGQNTLLRQNLNALKPIVSPVPERRENLKNPDTQQFPVEGLVPDNRSPQNSSVDQKPYNRGQITRRDDDNTKDITIGLQDHDEAIDYYFKNIIKPTVIKNGVRTEVPLIYGSPERWKSVQRDGFYRDKDYAISTETADHGASFSISVTANMSRVEKLNLIPLRGGKYPTTTKSDGGIANKMA